MARRRDSVVSNHKAPLIIRRGTSSRGGQAKGPTQRTETKRRALCPPSSESKRRASARRLLRVCRRCRAPGQSMTLPGLRRLLLFGLLGLLRLFRLLRFLSHSILSGFNGLKRDTRDARRRASLAKSSTIIPADSQAPAPCCHAAVTALSTDVMHFDALFAKIAVARTSCILRSSNRRAFCAPCAVTTSEPFARPSWGEDVADFGTRHASPVPIFINSKPQCRFHGGVESPLSGATACFSVE